MILLLPSLPLLLLLPAITVAGGPSGPSKPSPSPKCKSVPGDSSWPSLPTWSRLNSTLSGALLSSSPPAAVCHDPTYDEAACAIVKENFNTADWHLDKPFSPMNPRFTNYTCSPWTPRESPCGREGYAAYAIRAEGVREVVEGVKFARKHNLRLVVRNTGHDFLGKSTAPGALLIWTRPMKKIEHIPNYRSRGYSGPALRVGAGVEVHELYEFAAKFGLEAIGGECPTVGVAGGYTQGGGHSPLSNIHGLGADQTLEFTVVTTSGKVVTASPTQNSDLYWALSGGGAGTYGIVIEMVVKAYKTGVVTANMMTFSLPLTEKESKDKFYQFLAFYHRQVSGYNDKGIYSYPLYGLLGPAYTFMLQPFLAPRLGKMEVETILGPLREKMKELGIVPVLDETTEYPTFYDAAKVVFPGETTKNSPVGGRLIPRKDLAANPELIEAAFQKFIDEGGIGVEFSLRPTRKIAGNPDNAVNPIWRENEIHVIIGAAYPDVPSAELGEVRELDRKVTEEWDAAFKKATPNGGQYGNEGDYNDPEWKKSFYGKSYERLKKIKEKWDPEGLLWVRTGVGSEDWEEQGGVGGRLCKVGRK